MKLLLIALLAAYPFQLSFGGSLGGTVLLHSTNNKAVSDASGIVVFLTPKDGKSGSFPAAPLQKMVSQDKEFVPKVLPVLVGSSVEFPNNDLIFHNVFSLSKAKPFDLGLYKKDVHKKVMFDKSGIVKVYCNIHEKMVGYVVVLENPYFALTDTEGKFAIKDIPEGSYEATVWYRFSDPIKKNIEITRDGQVKMDLKLVKGTEVDFELIEKENSVKHPNKFGKEYKDKY